MKSLLQFTETISIFAAVLFQAHADYTSLYVFGDALSTTTNNNVTFPTSTNYYGKRFSNGRVWVEVLAQRQGLPYDFNKNWSYFDCNSSNLVTNVKNFNAPADATNALFVIWVNNSDLFDVFEPDANTNPGDWTDAINRSQTNYFQAITNLYAKGLRTLIAPNAVDLSKVPNFNIYTTTTNFLRQRCIDYNTNFAATLNQARAACPELTIYSPDFFKLLNNVLTNAAFYGLTNVTSGGLTIDAVDAVSYGFPKASTNGYGTNYIFWDYLNPTAKLHAVMADVAQQLISPVQVTSITAYIGSNQLDVVDMPVGLNGFVDGVTDLTATNWTAQSSFTSINTTQSVFVPTTGPRWFYRLRFPYAWSWP